MINPPLSLLYWQLSKPISLSCSFYVKLLKPWCYLWLFSGASPACPSLLCSRDQKWAQPFRCSLASTAWGKYSFICALVDAAQHPVGFLCCSSILFTCGELLVHQEPQVCSHRAASLMGRYQPVLHFWITFYMMQDITLDPVELNKVLVSSLFQPVQVSLQGNWVSEVTEDSTLSTEADQDRHPRSCTRLVCLLLACLQLLARALGLPTCRFCNNCTSVSLAAGSKCLGTLWDTTVLHAEKGQCRQHVMNIIFSSCNLLRALEWSQSHLGFAMYRSDVMVMASSFSRDAVLTWHMEGRWGFVNGAPWTPLTNCACLE